MLRLFSAVEIPEEVAAELQPRMRQLDGARWRPPEALHVTLRFFGDVPGAMAEDLDAELSRLSGRPFDLALKGVGAFGDPHQSQTVWAGLTDSEPLRALASRCEAAAVRAGLRREARTYKPHVTLAYLRGAQQDRVAAWLARHGDLSSAPFRVTWFGVWSSVLHPNGSRYTLEREYPLQ